MAWVLSIIILLKCACEFMQLKKTHVHDWSSKAHWPFLRHNAQTRTQNHFGLHIHFTHRRYRFCLMGLKLFTLNCRLKSLLSPGNPVLPAGNEALVSVKFNWADPADLKDGWGFTNSKKWKGEASQVVLKPLMFFRGQIMRVSCGINLCYCYSNGIKLAF